MKRSLLLILTMLALVVASCNKEKESERFRLLTAHAWTSDSLLANGADAGGPGGVLEEFRGDVIFKKDGTGSFGSYTGTWYFEDDEATLTIRSTELAFPLATKIEELTETSLKVSFLFPGLNLNIRMTFKPK